MQTFKCLVLMPLCTLLSALAHAIAFSLSLSFSFSLSLQVLSGNANGTSTDPVSKVQRTYLHFLKDAFPQLYGATAFAVRSATDTNPDPQSRGRQFKPQKVWLALSHDGVTLLSHGLVYAAHAKRTFERAKAEAKVGPRPGTSNGPTMAQLASASVFYAYTEVSARFVSLFFSLTARSLLSMLHHRSRFVFVHSRIMDVRFPPSPFLLFSCLR